MQPHFEGTAVPPDARIITLPRSGTRPLSFKGHLVAEAGGPPEDTKHVVRWHELKLYRHDDGRYVLHIAFRCSTRFDKPDDEVFICDDAQHVVETLEDFDAGEAPLGWPIPQYADKDRRVRAALEADFELLVSQLLAGEEFAERV